MLGRGRPAAPAARPGRRGAAVRGCAVARWAVRVSSAHLPQPGLPIHLCSVLACFAPRTTAVSRAGCAVQISPHAFNSSHSTIPYKTRGAPRCPAAQVAALHQLGPDYQSPLTASESSGLLDQHAAAAAALALGSGQEAAAGPGPAALPQGPPPRLLLAFCPKLAAAVENADADGSGGARQVGSRMIREAVAGLPAALLAGTQLCRARRPSDMLHCLGGVAVLLPLLEQAGGGSGGGEVAAGVLRLLAAMLRGSPGNQQAMQEIEGGGGPMVIVYTCISSLPHW